MDINFKNGSSIEVSEDMGTLHSVVNIPTQKDIDDMLKFFGVDSDKMVDCPECLMRCQIKFMITHLNDKGNTWSASYKMSELPKSGPTQIKSFDNHQWTFKQIGKWLESLGY